MATSSSDSHDGVELDKADAGSIAALFERPDKPSNVTAYQLFEDAHHQAIQDAIDEHEALTVGERRSIKSRLFKALEPDVREAYEKEAEEINRILYSLMMCILK